MAFQLVACAEMLWQDKPIAWRASRLKELGFGVGLWNWPTAQVGKRLGVDRLNLHGTGLGDGKIASRTDRRLYRIQIRCRCRWISRC